MQYISWEHHKPTKSQLVTGVNIVQGAPLFSEDRYRIRPPYGGKDFRADGSETRQYLYKMAANGGWAGIWGFIPANDQDFGSEGNYPNREELKKFSRFFTMKLGGLRPTTVLPMT